MDLSKLKEPFKAEDIEWRIQQSGETNGRIWAKVLAYVTARAIENRLDEVCGPENWKNEFRKEGENGEYLCGISIKIDGEWVTKWDGCSASGTNSNIDGFKTALSGSIKRAAATGWGIGRYLYSLDEGWAVICDDGMYSAKLKIQTNGSNGIRRLFQHGLCLKEHLRTFRHQKVTVLLKMMNLLKQIQSLKEESQRLQQRAKKKSRHRVIPLFPESDW